MAAESRRLLWFPVSHFLNCTKEIRWFASTSIGTSYWICFLLNLNILWSILKTHRNKMIGIQQLVILVEFSWPHPYFNFNLSLNPERFISAHCRHFEMSLTKSIFANASQRGPLLFNSRKCITSQTCQLKKSHWGTIVSYMILYFAK